MKLWISKNSEIPIREQLVTQITLGIASGDLKIGVRLPSTREIAMRYGVHSNTVSHAYQQLAEHGWLEYRAGSGFFVCEAGLSGDALDRMTRHFVKSAKTAGFSGEEILRRLMSHLGEMDVARVFLIESDGDLRRILVDEIRDATGHDVTGGAPADVPAFVSEGAVFASLFDEHVKFACHLTPTAQRVVLKTRSAAASMTGRTRPARDEIVAVVSGWPKFLALAKVMLVAANLDPESLLLRLTSDRSWKKGLGAAALVICDSLTAKHFGDDPRLRIFPVIADESLAEMRNVLNGAHSG